MWSGAQKQGSGHGPGAGAVGGVSKFLPKDLFLQKEVILENSINRTEILTTNWHDFI